MKLKTLLAILPIIAWATPQDVEPFAFKPTNDKNAYCFMTKSSSEFTPYHEKAFSKYQIEEIYTALIETKDELATDKTIVNQLQALALVGVGMTLLAYSKVIPLGLYSQTKKTVAYSALGALFLIRPIYNSIRKHNAQLFISYPEISKQEMETRMKDDMWNKFITTWGDSTVFEQVAKNLDILSARFKSTTPNTDVDCQ